MGEKKIVFFEFETKPPSEQWGTQYDKALQNADK